MLITNIDGDYESIIKKSEKNHLIVIFFFTIWYKI